MKSVSLNHSPIEIVFPMNEAVPESSLESRPLTLDQFLKQSGVVGSGGQAKILIQGGEVLLNGVVETRRGKKLVSGDIVQIGRDRLSVP